MVDVNVHPAKQEVRFHQSRMIFQTLVSFIETNLKQWFQSIDDFNSIKKQVTIKGKVESLSAVEPDWELSMAGNVRNPAVREERSQEYIVKEIGFIVLSIFSLTLVFTIIVYLRGLLSSLIISSRLLFIFSAVSISLMVFTVRQKPKYRNAFNFRSSVSFTKLSLSMLPAIGK